MTKLAWRVAGRIGLATWLIAGSSIAGGQPVDAMQRANQAIAAADWLGAEAALRSVVADEPGNAIAWLQLARTLDEQRKYDGAIDAGRHALAAGHPAPAVVRVAIARAQAAGGDHEAALGELKQAAAAGPNRALLSRIESTAAFDPLETDARWAALVERLTPCATPEYRQFDFWIGDFRVEDPNGNYVGDNRIDRHLGGCMLMESWTGATGMHGISMNFYDPADGTWNQIFVDNNGAPGNWPPLKGRFENGAMVLSSPQGDSRTRWTWSVVADGRVRQMAESTSDGGKTWQTIWDSYYIRRQE